MGKTTETTITWICDSCNKQIESGTRPDSASDPWAYFTIDQDAAFDHHGHPWAPRFREPILLCSNCIQLVIDLINRKDE